MASSDPMRPGRLLPIWLALLTGLIPETVAAQLRTLETEHLRIIHGASTGFIVPYTARCIENSLRFHRARFEYVQREKLNVILDDREDFGNAGVWGNPRSSMIVQIAPQNFVYETGPSNERIHHTMNHEGTHVVALDQAAGADLLFRRLFSGKVREIAEHPETILYQYLTLPRRAAPRWYHEGLAVFMETWMAGGLGRAQGPYDEMVFRSMVRDQAHFYDPLGLESQGTKVDFQVGVNSYLYGTRFLTYLAYTHSPDTLMRWVARRPGSHAYFAAQFREVFGRSLNESWRDWIRFEQDFQRANLDSIRRYPTTDARDLSDRALGSVSRAFVDSVGNDLIAAVFYPGEFAHIAAIPLNGGPPRKLTEVAGPALYFVSSLAFDARGRRVFYTTDNGDWRDLRVLELANGRTRLLQRDARVGDLVFDANDQSLWGMRHFNGLSTLVRMAPPYASWKQVRTWTYGEDPYDLDLSPDGRHLSYSLGEISGRQTLRMASTESLLAGDSTATVLHDFGGTVPNHFVFSRDGRRLYGSSYYTGVSNLFRYDLEQDSMEVLTNAETGFFRPLPLGGDSLIAFRYSGAGFVPARIAERSLEDVSATTYLGERLVARHPSLRTWITPPPSSVPIDSLITYRGKYRGLANLRLAGSYPIVEGYKDQVSVGGRLEFSDPFSLHEAHVSASITPDVGPEDERWHIRAGYKHRRWSAGGWYNGASFYDLVGATKTSRKGYGGQFAYSRVLLDDGPHTRNLSLNGSGFARLERLVDNQNVATSAGFDKVITPGIELRDKIQRSSIGAADYEKGHVATLEVSAPLVRFVRGGDAAWRGFPRAVGTLDLGTPLPGRNASVWLRTAGGYAPGDRDEPFANFYFGGFGNNGFDFRDPQRYREWGSFPGLAIDGAGGTNFAKAVLDWNLPPVRFERLGTLALYAAWARASVFAGGLTTNLDDAARRRRVGDAGAQVDVRFQFLTQQELTLSFGFARAFERRRAARDEWMISLKVL